MYAAKVLLFLAAGVSASLIAERVPLGAIEARAVLQGWSLQASTCPTSSKSCGAGSCCPSSLFCNPAANDEVAACCTTAQDCRGAVEGAPACADNTWNLYKGLNGNGFCCMPGMVGIYDYHNTVAGTCVTSAAAGATLAVWMSTGSSAATATGAAGASSAASAAMTATSAMTSAMASATAAATAASNATLTGASSTSTPLKSGAEKVGMGMAAMALAFVAVLAL